MINSFSGNTNPFMPILDDNGNYKKTFKIHVGDFSEKKAIKRLRELRETLKTTINMENINYVQTVPNSHYWTDLNQIIGSIDHELQRKNREQNKEKDDYFVYIGEPLTKEYLLIGLNNSKKNGYKIKEVRNIDLNKFNYSFFPSIDNMIEYITNKYNDDYIQINNFQNMIITTINIGLNLTNGLKIDRREIYKRISVERDYQDMRWNTNLREGDIPDEEKPIAEWLNYIEYHLSKAKESNYHLNNEETLAEVRKITALAVRCMEIHGCPERNAEIYRSDSKNPKIGCDCNNCKCNKHE